MIYQEDEKKISNQEGMMGVADLQKLRLGKHLLSLQHESSQ
jgi:hypothetical protein